MYYAGQLGHGKDHKRSAGGFIHGFRYTTRAMFRMLETKYQQVHWPARHVYTGVQQWDGGTGLGGFGCNAGDLLAQAPDGCTEPKEITTPFEAMLNQLFTRIDTASGPYQMVAVLGDGVVFRCPGAAVDGSSESPTIEAEFLEEMPLDLFNEKYDRLPRLWWSFGYRQQRKSLWEAKRYGTYFQVQFWYHSGDCAAPDADPTKQGSFGGHADGRYHPGSTAHREPARPSRKELVQIHEDVHTRWGQPSRRTRIGRWLHKKIAGLRPGHVDPNEAEKHWINPARMQDFNDAQMSKKMAEMAAEDYDPAAAAADAAEQGQVPDPSISINWGRQAEEVRKWEGAHVDLNFFNRRETTVQLWSSGVTSDVNRGVAAQQFEPGPTLAPGAGKRVVSHEYERWEARDSAGNRVGQWWIDRANGLVQDVAV